MREYVCADRKWCALLGRGCAFRGLGMEGIGSYRLRFFTILVRRQGFACMCSRAGAFAYVPVVVA
jgi:hypothetical protein